MKKYINTLWMCMLLLLVGVSCSDSESTPEPEPVIPPKITLDSESEYMVTDKGSQLSISFTTNKEWTVSSNQSWCSPTTKSGAPGNITVPVNVDKNETYDSREAVITIQSGTVKKTVKVDQVQMDAIILAKNNYEVEPDKVTLNFEVQSNVEFKMDTDVDWIKLVSDKSRGLTTYKLSVDIDENLVEEQREGHVLITKDDIKQVLTIVQKKCKPQEVVITHNLPLFVIPTIQGTITNGRIFWGDEKEEEYAADAQHAYDGTGNHKVAIKLNGAEDVTLKSIKGVLEVDLSEF